MNQGMSVNDNDLFDIVRSVWSTVVSLDLERIPEGAPRDDINSEFLCAWMEASGAWNGGLLLSCQESLAREAASIMYEVDDGMLGEDAVHDTFGELANMIAGSTKVLLPAGVTLEQPMVLEEAELPEACLSTWPQLNIATHNDEQMLYVSLFRWEEED